MNSLCEYYDTFNPTIDLSESYKFVSVNELQDIILKKADEFGDIIDTTELVPNISFKDPVKVRNLLEKFALDKKKFSSRDEIAGLAKKAITDIAILSDQDYDTILYTFCKLINYPIMKKIYFMDSVVSDFLKKNILKSSDNYSIVPVQSVDMGLSYVLSSLFFNKILQYGDVVGIITPCSSSILEIPMAETFSLAINCISMEKNGLISESELEKIKDANMKVLVVVNPSDIYGITISSIMIDKIQKIILEQNKNLLIIQDVSMSPYIDNMLCFYGPNVISIFSYSMFFGHGSTVIALPEHNIIDSILLPNSMENFNIEKQLTDRYSPHNINISKITFADRIYLDAVFVSGRNRSYIVSSSDQLLLALYSVCNYKKYSKYIKNLLKNRLIKLKLSLGIHDLPQEMYSMDVLPEDTPYYYMDLLDVSTKIVGDSEFSKFISNNYNTYEFCFELASEIGVILLPGSVFNNKNKWGFRVPLVALTEDECTRLGMLLRNKIIELFDSYKEYVDKNDKLRFGIDTTK